MISLVKRYKGTNSGKKGEASRLAETCPLGQPLDGSWIPGQPLDRSGQDQIEAILQNWQVLALEITFRNNVHMSLYVSFFLGGGRGEGGRAQQTA